MRARGWKVSTISSLSSTSSIHLCCSASTRVKTEDIFAIAWELLSCNQVRALEAEQNCIGEIPCLAVYIAKMKVSLYKKWFCFIFDTSIKSYSAGEQMYSTWFFRVFDNRRDCMIFAAKKQDAWNWKTLTCFRDRRNFHFHGKKVLGCYIRTFLLYYVPRKLAKERERDRDR